MNDPAKSMSDVLRRAGKTTVILQIFSVGLLIFLCVLYLDLSKRYALLQDGVRENAMWSVYQLDREARALDHEMDLALATPGGLDPARKKLATRYDILYSRVNLLKDSRFQDFFVGDKTITDSISEITRIVMAEEPVFNNIKDKSKDDAALLQQTSNDIDALIGTTQNFLTYTNTRISEARSDNRSAAANLERTSAIFLVLLIASVLFLIVNLHRQLSNMRDAGVSMEAMTRKLSDAYNSADAGNRAKSQFMATIGHEIRTPLNAILGMAELLELSKLQPDVLENVRSIRGSGEALLEILNEILDFSKIEHGKLELENRPVDIRTLAESTVNIIRGRATEHGNTITLDIPENLEASVVKTDPTRLRQIILNLMSNAVKFTDKGTVTLKVRIVGTGIGMRVPDSTASGIRLRIEVIDTGIGIDEAGKEKLFKPFSQVDATISRKYGGTGLGLTICKEIVERLGGEMGIESRLGFGSTFWFEIPVIATDEPVAGGRELNPTSLPGLPKMKILLVEDNRVNQQVATRFLNRLGQEIAIAGNGSIAVAMANQATYDLVLMDMQMPVMDGIEATRCIRSGNGPNSKTPIVAMTANASEDDRRACVDAGMQGFELKPITMARLHTLLAQISDENGLVMPDVPAIDLQPNNVVQLIPTEPSAGEVNTNIAELDAERRAELIEALGEDDFQELLSSYFDDIDVLLTDLDVALTNNDPTSIDRALHTIKGAAANIGFTSIAAMAEGLRHNQQPKHELNRLIALITSQKTNKAA